MKLKAGEGEKASQHSFREIVDMQQIREVETD
jgi:hypothetical protein